KMPERTLCDSSEALGSVNADMPAALEGEDLRAAGGHLLRPYDHPVPVLHLLDAHQVVAEVAGAVEAQLALDGVDAIRLEPGRNRLVVEALGRGDAGLEDLPSGVRSGGLGLDRRVAQAGLGGA